jgi:hypothetical protein
LTTLDAGIYGRDGALDLATVSLAQPSSLLVLSVLDI